MALAPRLQQYLTRKGIAFEDIALEPMANLDAAVIASGEAQGNILQATLMIDLQGVVMVVHPFDTALDEELMTELTGRRLQPLSSQQADRLFSDCDPGFHPPVGAAYGLTVLVDQDVLTLEHALLSSGTDRSLVRLDRRNLKLALADAHEAHVVIRGPGAGSQTALSLDDVATQLQKLYRLPPMPALALRILRLTANPEASARELADLIELDPSLTAQILRYARSALFNYPGQIQSVQEAVTRVLGFDRVAHVAMGIASVRAFDVPREGMLGMDQFWRHSLYCAFLCQHLAQRCGGDKSLAYLCGLLHNFGLLLIGHLFPAEFDELNAMREANPEASMRSLEQQVFGGSQQHDMLTVGHGAIGGILHRLWQLPDAVVKAAGVHQQLDYHGDHENYVLMVQLANAMLKEQGIGDEFNPEDTAPLLARLGLDDSDLNRLNQEMERVSGDLDTLARSLTA
ncbi:MAG: HDOD domain-containing protein [Pseudomonadales bacterium]|nr:HDOD domain-containing protein [Pseudomonadales bacterium]